MSTPVTQYPPFNMSMFVDPSGRKQFDWTMSKAWIEYFLRAVATGNATAGTSTAFILPATDPTLPNGEVLTNTPTITWDFSTPHQAKGTANIGALRDCRFARKASSQSVVSSTTLVDDADLQVTIAANDVWVVEYVLSVDGDTAGDFKWALNVPAGATGIQTGYRLQLGALTTTDTINTAATTDLTDTGVQTAGLAGAGTPVFIFVRALVVNSGTAGTIKLRWAQQTASATATRVLLNSHLVAERMQ
jgi:hypothetical protein